MTVDLALRIFASGIDPAWIEENRTKNDAWFAWHPVRLGALGTGRLVWLRRVWRSRCMGTAIYQRLGT